MRRAVLILPFVLLLVSLVTAGEAEARRGRGIPLPIPGLRSEVVVKVLELPRSPNLMYEGKPIDLGYKFYSGSGGEWVGYIGPDTSYLPFKPDGLERTLALAGLRGLPPRTRPTMAIVRVGDARHWAPPDRLRIVQKIHDGARQ